ncbi:hypothetical protein IMCC3317_38930 [Kordia antarctica]|uniref:SprT-like domain-containing protein n=1 Tax=Kordia antarctica TaxID=1218801 RepID=A0A7L4ZPR8_9FLAO|nr:hypothetical protein [Kordia antarctica]QHI38500.1 hypothetical protein IMCC3317_38930 [Kordia antarctica]
MKKHIFIYFILLFLFSCDNDEFHEAEELENHVSTDLRIQYKRGSEVSASALDFIKSRTNNTFTVTSKKGEVKLNSSLSLSKNNELGTVDTSKEIVVINENNTKHTFKVIAPSEHSNTVINLIVVEKETDSYEYFLKYTFAGELPINEETGTTDFSEFNGTIETFNADGALIGSMTIENGIITNDQGQLSPCPDDSQEPTDDNTNVDSNTGGSDSSTGIPNDDNTDDPLSSGNGDPNQSSQFTDPNGDCGLTWAYESCGCGGSPNGHAPQGVDCCQGSPLVIRDCNGTVIAQRDSNTSTTIFKRNGFDPCDDGDVGVILDDDVLCAMDNDSFNAYYSNKSPFDVDLNDVRRYCDSITPPDPENEKFMCVYNKLVNSPKFKHLFTDVFGDSENLNVKFEIVDVVSATNPHINANCQASGTLDSNGNLVNALMTIKIKRSHINGDPRISLAKTILHECIHAYIKLKKLDSNQGTTFQDINNETLGQLINQYYGNGQFSNGQHGHEFMFDYMLPSMQQMLSDVRDNLVPENHRQIVESRNYQSSSNPVVSNHPWDWNEFYYYYSLLGLHNTNAFEQQIESNPIKNYLYGKYNGDGELLSSSYCQD